jgi:hypothetical protein
MRRGTDQEKRPFERKEFLMADKDALGAHVAKEQFDVFLNKMTTRAREAASTTIARSSAAAGIVALEPLFADAMTKAPVQANVSPEEHSAIEVMTQTLVEKTRIIVREAHRLANRGE